MRRQPYVFQEHYLIRIRLSSSLFPDSRGFLRLIVQDNMILFCSFDCCHIERGRGSQRDSREAGEERAGSGIRVMPSQYSHSFVIKRQYFQQGVKKYTFPGNLI